MRSAGCLWERSGIAVRGQAANSDAPYHTLSEAQVVKRSGSRV